MKYLVGSQLVIIIFALLLCGFIGMWTWPYTINTWLEVAGKEPAIGKGTGFLLGFCPVIGQLSIPAAVITWIAVKFIK